MSASPSPVLEKLLPLQVLYTLIWLSKFEDHSQLCIQKAYNSTDHHGTHDDTAIIEKMEDAEHTSPASVLLSMTNYYFFNSK